jgi:2-oxo-4-hydroxy-4-carboxy-5-ureidoimidazoline decarboxylase
MAAGKITLEEINRGDAAAFVAALGEVFENAPWLAARAATARPFASSQALAEALMATLAAASADEKQTLIAAHPDLAGKAARAGTLSDASTREQAGAGLDRLSDTDYDRFQRLNAAYRRQFGFPFIIAVRDHDKDAILAAFERRLTHTRAAEIDEAVGNIGRIVTLRIRDIISE